jgi:hypothetical protein
MPVQPHHRHPQSLLIEAVKLRVTVQTPPPTPPPPIFARGPPPPIVYSPSLEDIKTLTLRLGQVS